MWERCGSFKSKKAMQVIGASPGTRKLSGRLGPSRTGLTTDAHGTLVGTGSTVFFHRGNPRGSKPFESIVPDPECERLYPYDAIHCG